MTSDGRVVFGKRRSRVWVVVIVLVILAIVGTLAGVAAAAILLTESGRTPREWAVYLRSQNVGGSATAAKFVDQVADYLNRVDGIGPADGLTIPQSHGASAARSGDTRIGHVRLVRTVDALRDAVASSLPNDIILLAPGTYRVTGGAVQFATIGNRDGRLTLRAATLGDVVIESDVVEAFNVSGPFWQFENLVMRGVCGDHGKCEHAIHISGAATDTTIRNSRFEDFNAHLKINGDRGEWPDNGVIEGNTLVNTAPRRTQNPIVPIDLVGASEWRVSGNVIADFAREGRGQPTYGAYFKGAGQKNVFERNVVLCAWKLKDSGGARVGVSLGGGGTDPAQRRDRGALGMEQVGSVIRDNLIAFCSDAGIYLNRAARSTIAHNTLLDTAGIDGRFIETSGDVVANIVDGAIRTREGATLRGWDNDHPYLLGLFFGHHPQQAYFRDLVKLDLGWVRAPDKLAPDPNDTGTDLCGEKRGPLTRAGAFDDYAACLKRQ
ncbi:MAG: right-handed parallel beta-helix repeat-containing protein [Acetobacteraceae bacterium]